MSITWVVMIFLSGACKSGALNLPPLLVYVFCLFCLFFFFLYSPNATLMSPLVHDESDESEEGSCWLSSSYELCKVGSCVKGGSWLLVEGACSLGGGG